MESVSMPLSDQGISHPLVPKGGGGLHGIPLRKPLSQWNFVMNATLDIYTLKRTLLKQENQKMIYRFKMVAKLHIFASHHFDFGENLKTIFQRNFSMKFGSQ